VEDPITGVLDLVNRGSSLLDYLFWWNNKVWQGTGALPTLIISYAVNIVCEHVRFRRWAWNFYGNLQRWGKVSQVRL